MSFVDAAQAHGRKTGQIKLHSAADFEPMRRAGWLAAEALDLLTPMVKPGVMTAALDQFAFQFGMDHRAYPAPLGYRGFRKSICTSINHVVCHGIPDNKPLRHGDIVNIDVTFILDGWHGDSSRMYIVGEAPRRAGDPAFLVASSAKIRRELGWEPRHPDLEDIVASAWRWRAPS